MKIDEKTSEIEKLGEMQFDRILGIMRSSWEDRKPIQSDVFINSIRFFFFSKNEEQKEDYYTYVDSFLQDPEKFKNFKGNEIMIFTGGIIRIVEHNHKWFKIVENYMIEKVKDKNLECKVKIFLLDVLYHSKKKGYIMEAFLKEYTEYVKEEMDKLDMTVLIALFTNFLFIEDKYLVTPLYPDLVRMLLEKAKDPKKNFKLFQIYPRFFVGDKEKLKETTEIIVKYLNSFENNIMAFPHQIDLLVQVLSKLHTFSELPQSVLEMLLPIIHLNFSGMGDFSIQNTFIILIQYPFDKFVNVKKVELMITDLITTIKSQKDNKEEKERRKLLKEAQYQIEIQEKNKQIFNDWIVGVGIGNETQGGAPLDQNEEKLKKFELFEELINKNTVIHPFHCENLTTDTFQMMFDNFCSLVKLEKVISNNQ